MFNVMTAIRSAASGASVFPITDQLKGQWDASVGVTGSAPMTVWADQSGNGNDWLEDIGQSGGGPTLSSSVLNGLDVVTFDGTNDKMIQTAFISGTTDGSMALVMRRTTTNNKGWSVFGSSSTQPHFQFSNLIYETFGCTTRPAGVDDSGHFDLNEWGVYIVTKANGGNLIRYANTTQIDSVFASQGWATSFRLGCGQLGGTVGATNSFQGEIAEMAIWDKVISAGERTSVFDYFNAKFALGL